MSGEKKLAQLGFGFMRLPEKDVDGRTVIDHERVCEMVDAFMDAGFTYFDTAYGYHGGNSEGALKAALVDRYPREAYTVATKLLAWLAKNAEEARGMLDTSLERLGVDCIDYYLLHNLGGDLTQGFEDFGLWEFVARKKAEGVLRHVGFSIHDKADALDEVLTKHPEVDFVQLQINYADWESPVIESRKCYEVARSHGKPVVVMEPVKGGSLVKLPDAAASILREANPDASFASWALRFAASLDGVLAVLSGMSTLDQVRDNVQTMRAAMPLGESERAVVGRVQDVLDGFDIVPCTDCKYCVEGCPQGIRIPVALQSLNIMTMFGDEHRAKENLLWNMAGSKAADCIACGACEEVCPQHIDIVDSLKRVADTIEG